MDISSIEGIRYAGVQITREGLAKVYGARTELSITKNEIRAMRLVYGVPGERRWLQLIVGPFLLGLAALQIVNLILWLIRGGTRSVADILVLVFLIGIGGWVTWDAFRKQWYVAVETQDKTHKLAFDEKPNPEMLKRLIQIGARLGYPIDATQFNAAKVGQPES